MDSVKTPELSIVEHAGRTTVGDQMEHIIRIADYLEKGQRNTTRLMELTGLSRPTVIKYRNEAMKLIHRENKAFNTAALRQMEIGRLNNWIDDLTLEIKTLGDDKDDREYKNKLLGRLDNFQGRLHAITGLNTTVNVNYEEKKRITFVMSGGNTGSEQKPNKEDDYSLPGQAQPEPTEAEIVDSPTS